MSLRWRMAVVFATATAVLLAAAGLVLLHLLRQTLDDSMRAQLHAREGVLARFVLVRGGDLEARPLPRDPLDWPYPPQAGQTAQVFTPDDVLVLSMSVPDDEPLLSAPQLDRARRSPLELRTAPGSAGDGDFVRAIPVQRPGDGRWVVVVGADVEGADAVQRRTRTALLVAGPLAIVLSAVGAWLLAGASLRPVERLRRQAAALSADDTGASLEIPQTSDEIAALATTMNDLLHRLQQALSRERRFVADAGHELRTPLTVLRAELELAARSGRSVEELREAVGFATVEVDRLIRLSERLLLLAKVEDRHSSLLLVPTRLRALLESAAHGAAARCPDVVVQVEVVDDLVAPVDPDGLRQAVDNLLDNATRHAPGGSAVTLTLRVDRAGAEPVAVIEISDRGPGFPADFLQRAFERFERADADRGRGTGGNGLGLAITRAIVAAHGGRAVALNREGGGAVVRLELPVVDPPVVAPRVAAP